MTRDMNSAILDFGAGWRFLNIDWDEAARTGSLTDDEHRAIKLAGLEADRSLKTHLGFIALDERDGIDLLASREEAYQLATEELNAYLSGTAPLPNMTPLRVSDVPGVMVAF